jgi:hypothetical protein
MPTRFLKTLATTGALIAVAPIVLAQTGTFEATPTWEGIKACNGQPVQSPSPKFLLKNLPAATAEIEFQMADLDAPSFKHGGGKVKNTGSSEVAAGSFNFIGPCPPSPHRYEWTITARGPDGRRLATTRAIKNYP